MPLAIELAAARLRSMSLSELHDRLDQRFRLLTGGSRTALERQQTLRATVAWSYSLLTGAEQVLLGRLSVFAGSFGLDTAEAVCGSGGLDVLDVAALLGSLVDKSLVVAEPAATALRYRLLETIRLFAAERLVEAGDEQAAAVATAHCAHYLAVAETAAAYLTGPEQGSWLARLDADQANLAARRRSCGRRPDGTALVLRLGIALDRYWSACSRQQEAFGLLVPALRRPDARADPALFAAALVTAARAACRIDGATARQLAEQAVQVTRQLGDERLLSRALTVLCGAYFFTGEPEAGRPFGQESVERARRLGDDVQLASSLVTYLMTIDPARSGPLYTEAIACTERSGDHLANSTLHDNAGADALAAGDLPAARAHLEAAAQAAQQIGRDSATLRRTWVTCSARRETSTAPGPPSRQACGSAAGTATTGTWPPPSWAWPAWPRMRATGTGQRRCTAPRRPFGTGPEIHGTYTRRVDAGTAWTKRVRTWAMSSWSRPTPRAWRSASTRPSIWPSGQSRPPRNRLFCAAKPPRDHHPPVVQTRRYMVPLVRRRMLCPSRWVISAWPRG